MSAMENKVPIGYIGDYLVSWDPQFGTVWVGQERASDRYGEVTSEYEALEVARLWIEDHAY